MARVVVVGGGLGGMAAAARLAKLGHEVTLVERSRVLGGALAPEAEEGFRWDAGPSATLLPAVLRDLFRKTGRPLERELELEPLPFIREHRFEDGTSLRLPGGSRAAQVAAMEALGPGLGERWAEYVSDHTDVWDVLRRGYLEVPWDRERLPRELASVLESREVLHRRLRRELKDERLRLVAGHPFVAEGHDLRNVPAWLGVLSYVEQRFGAWSVAGGMAGLAEALAERLATRKVDVLRETSVRDLVVRGGRVAAVATSGGELAADVVSHLGLSGDVPDLGPEVVLHGDPMLVVRTGGHAPAGCSAWTVHGRGKLAEDMLRALARHGIDVRAHVVVRVDRSPRDLVERWGGSPMGVLWQGRATVRRRLGPTTPVPGVYAAGAHATPGAGVPFVGLSAALVAQSVGPA